MREIINCKREFSGLAEDKRPAYLIRMGAALTLNAGVFPDIPYAGSVITADALVLLGLLGVKDASDANMTAYNSGLAAIIAKVDENYDDIDLVAQGDALIVAKAGVNGTSGNTTRTGIPGEPENLKFEFAPGAGDIFLTREVDKLAMGSVIVTFTDPDITVVKSANTQLKITTADGKFIFVDVVTVIKALIQSQQKKSEIMSVVANFNPNGLSPIASPTPAVVPR